MPASIGWGYVVNLTILEPQRFADELISSRLYCHSKALWKLTWFLRDFGYDSEASETQSRAGQVRVGKD